MPPPPRRGYTLIELFVVIAIIAVLIGLLTRFGGRATRELFTLPSRC